MADIGRFCCKTPFSAKFDFWEADGRGIRKIGWGTSQFVDWAACEVLNRSAMVLSGNVPSDCNLASFRHARIFRLFQRNPPRTVIGATAIRRQGLPLFRPSRLAPAAGVLIGDAIPYEKNPVRRVCEGGFIAAAHCIAPHGACRRLA